MFQSNGCYVLTNVRITNRGAAETTITNWSLQLSVGNDYRQATLVPIPTSWSIERPSSAFDSKKKLELISRPTLDEITRDDGLRPGIAKMGWLLFQYDDYRTAMPPYTAAVRVDALDAFGEQHTARRPAQFYEDTGTIKIESNPS